MLPEFAAVGTALGALKTISEIAKNVNSIELTQKIIELQSSILELQKEMTQLLDENRSLRTQLDVQQEAETLAADLEFVEDGGFFIRSSERDAGKSIAYCPTCWGSDQKLIPLNPLGSEGYFRCEVHSAIYRTKGYRPPQRRIRTVATIGGPWS